MTKPRINKDTNLADLATHYPHAARVLNIEYGLHCLGCFASAFDTLEAGAKIHGMTESEIEEMLQHLNEIIEKEGGDQDV